MNWLPTILQQRDIAELYKEFDHQVAVNDNQYWIPDNFDDYILICRLWHVDARFAEFKKLRGEVASAPGTPWTMDERYRNREEQAAGPTPLAADPGDAVEYDEVVNRSVDPA